MQPNTAHPDARAVDLRPLRWSRATPGPGTQLEVYYTVTGRMDCSTLGRVEVAETSQTVTITLLVGRLPGTDCGGVQPALAAPMMTVITLAAPLGTRQARDGAKP